MDRAICLVAPVGVVAYGCHDVSVASDTVCQCSEKPRLSLIMDREGNNLFGPDST